MNTLPKDVFRFIICQYLKFKDQIHLMETCRIFHEYVLDPIVFQKIYINKNIDDIPEYIWQLFIKTEEIKIGDEIILLILGLDHCGFVKSILKRGIWHPFDECEVRP